MRYWLFNLLHLPWYNGGAGNLICSVQNVEKIGLGKHLVFVFYFRESTHFHLNYRTRTSKNILTHSIHLHTISFKPWKSVSIFFPPLLSLHHRSAPSNYRVLGRRYWSLQCSLFHPSTNALAHTHTCMEYIHSAGGPYWLHPVYIELLVHADHPYSHLQTDSICS